jgi:hypothetical protein
MGELLTGLTADFGQPTTSLRQVIVNTHSPLLIEYFLQKSTQNASAKKAEKRPKTQQVRLLFSRQKTITRTFEDRKHILKCTQMVPIAPDGQGRLPAIPQNENMLTAWEAIQQLGAKAP